MAGLCVSVGGLFICALAFPPTRNMFSSWVAMSINYILLVLLMTLGLSLIVGIITSNVSTMATFSDCIIALVTLLIAGENCSSDPDAGRRAFKRYTALSGTRWRCYV
ncbi:hypothetical protein BC497_29555 (plasmid) [Klebsiella variicola]|uniref:type IV secretion system protein n=1 Tax=Klebsiella variicola TaxID=244366 RepID=UPI000E357F66|nr:type IV secretion system protein [Klebsiella variicola]AXO74123.1 hypothetical protein BC497_29555 [Klebsiella variicola]